MLSNLTEQGLLYKRSCKKTLHFIMKTNSLGLCSLCSNPVFGTPLKKPAKFCPSLLASCLLSLSVERGSSESMEQSVPMGPNFAIHWTIHGLHSWSSLWLAVWLCITRIVRASLVPWFKWCAFHGWLVEGHFFPIFFAFQRYFLA